MSLKCHLEPTGRFLALEIAHQLDDIIHVVEALQLALVVDELHGLFNDLRTRIETHLSTATSPLTHATDITQATYIVEELHQGVGGQLAVILDDLVIGKDVNTLHLIQT